MTTTTGFPCPECGTWTEVKETRGAVRRRWCANDHKFYTVETVCDKPPKKLPSKELHVNRRAKNGSE
jgi:hypothetical protein